MLGLNFEFMYGKWSSARPWPKVSAAQTRAFEKIKENCNYWCKRELKVADCPKPETILKTRKLDYSGDEIGKALPLVAAELEPGLPESEAAAQIPAAALCSPEMQLG